jgi:hypothetical protein
VVFTTLGDGDLIEVLPKAVKGANGKLEPFEAMLSTRIFHRVNTIWGRSYRKFSRRFLKKEAFRSAQFLVLTTSLHKPP